MISPGRPSRRMRRSLDGLRHGVGRAPAGLVDCPVAQEREEDAGESACEGHNGNPLAPCTAIRVAQSLKSAVRRPVDYGTITEPC